MFFGSWAGAFAANKAAGPYLRLMFVLFVWGLGGVFDLWRLPTIGLAVSWVAGAKLPSTPCL